MMAGRNRQCHDLAVLSVGFVQRPNAGADEAHDVLAVAGGQREVVVVGEDRFQPPLHLTGRRRIAQLAHEPGDRREVSDRRRSDHNSGHFIPTSQDSIGIDMTDHWAALHTVCMPKISGSSTVLTIRVTPETNRLLTRVARASRRTRSETARAILEIALAGSATVNPVAEAQRQSLLASQQPDQQDVLRFIATAPDLKGWR